MGLSVANILLEVTGESADAKRELADVARDLALFSREEAEAAAYVDGSEAQRELDELRTQLTAIDAKRVSAEVNVRIAKALGDIAALQTALKEVDGEEVEVDVEVKRDIVERLRALSGLIEDIDEEAEEASTGGLREFLRSTLDADVGVGRWSTSLANLLRLGPPVIAMVIALAGQILAVAASAINAVGGIGALGVAFYAALVPGVLLAIGAVTRFKEQSEIAGTAAHALKGALEDFAGSFKDATAGGADALFRGLADALETLEPVIASLEPAFTGLGQAGAEAMRGLAEHFASPVWREFFAFATESLTALTPLFARSFGALADILRNIATAAMPFLIDGFRSLAQFLEGLADDTSNIEALRGGIGGMVDSLAAWIDLMGGAVDLSAALVAALAPIGDEIVAALGEGARNLAEWIRSSEGAEKIKQFFEDTGPLAAEVGKLILNVGLALMQLGQFVAPAITPILKGFNQALGLLNTLLSWLNDHVPNGVRAALGTILSLVGGLAKVGKAGELLGAVLRLLVAAVGTVGGAFGDLGSAAARGFGAAIDWAKGAVQRIGDLVSKPISFVLGFADNIAERARRIWEGVKGVISDGIKFALQFAEGIAGKARNIWTAVKGVVTDGIKFVLNFADGIPGRARGIWNAVKGVIGDAINFVFDLPGEMAARARAIWEGVKGVISDAIQFVIKLPPVEGLVSIAKSIWDAINAALPDITIDIDIPKPDVPGFATGVHDFAGGLAEVGEMGRELAYLPSGTDVYTAEETKRILRALASGVARGVSPAAAGTPAAAGVGGNTYIDKIQVISPGTGSPDPDIAAAKLATILRARGGLRSA